VNATLGSTHLSDRDTPQSEHVAAQVGDNQRMERRSTAHTGLAPIELLRALPALVVLQRLPVATLAIAEDGAIVFANEACEEMLGYGDGELAQLRFREIFHTMPADEPVVKTLRAHADRVVELAHRDGSIVRARMSKSALMRGDDPVLLAAFHDLTEQLWTEEL
jgi:PAS domain S-box-containing protein